MDFHTKVLGMRFIKKTVLYDGSIPIYHLYYSNANGDPSAVVTTFPWAQQADLRHSGHQPGPRGDALGSRRVPRLLGEAAELDARFEHQQSRALRRSGG